MDENNTSNPRSYKPKPGLRLRRIGAQYMIVDPVSGRADLSRVYTLNASAAFMWERLCSGVCTAPALSSLLSREYDADPSVVLHDVERQLLEWLSCGLVE